MSSANVYIILTISEDIRQSSFQFSIHVGLYRPPLWSEFLGTDPEVLGSIPGASTFSEKQ
jgi:hypothetical protein